MQAYLVGGAVRDQLLQRPIHDRDWLAVETDADELRSLGYQQVGRDFPVFLHPESREEYALPRGDLSGETISVVAEDLYQRDLTINAMALSPEGLLIDPYGGRQDLENRYLRHVSEHFADEPIRILRTARLAAQLSAWSFNIADETLELMRELSAQESLQQVVAERLWAEIHKALAGPRPDIFIEILQACGALEKIMPEVACLFGVPQPVQYHPEVDTGIHTLLCLRQASKLSDDPKVRFATLCHDLGKGRTPPEEWPSHIKHELRGMDAATEMCQRLKVPREYRVLAELTARYHTHCHRAEELRIGKLVQALEEIGVLRHPERLEVFLLSCIADARGRPGFEDSPYPQADRFRKAAEIMRKVSAEELLAKGYEGAALGETLHQERIKAVRQAL